MQNMQNMQNTYLNMQKKMINKKMQKKMQVNKYAECANKHASIYVAEYAEYAIKNAR